MEKRTKEVEILKQYFYAHKEVTLAFLFGSKGKELGGKISDWDIGVYFTSKHLEWEEEKAYPQKERIWAELSDLLKTDNIDLIVLNRAPLSLVATILNEGLPLTLKDERIFLDLLLLSIQDAHKYRRFVDNYYKIYQTAKSFSESAKERLKKILMFLEEEMGMYDYFQKFTYKDYQDIHKRHEVERWVENLVNGVIDIGEIILASHRIKIPDYYREIFLKLATLKEFSDIELNKFTQWIRLRNVLAHEYLDIKWERIKAFIEESRDYFSHFLNKVKTIVL